MLSIKIDLKGLRPLLKGRAEKALSRALRKAGSTALRDMRSEAAKRVRERKAIKARVVRQALTMVRPKGSRIERMEWKLLVSGRPVRVRDYPHRQTKKGVSAEINKGKRTLIKSAFIAVMPSGHKGAFIRRGTKRLPIREIYSSNVAQALTGEPAKAVLIRGRRSLEDGVRRLLPIELAKDKG